jgi:uncharacterized protein
MGGESASLPTNAVRETWELIDWKLRIFELYAAVRTHDDPGEAWALWRTTRNDMFSDHPQSPIPIHQRAAFSGLDLYDYDPAYRVRGAVRDVEPRSYEIPTSARRTMGFTRIGVCAFALDGIDLELELYWLDAYGGGLFLPFRDKTTGTQTYGAGRYLYDSVKGADLGTELLDGSTPGIVLDFNFAYNPSCAYDPRWVCPLAPAPNHLEVPVLAGERSPPGS